MTTPRRRQFLYARFDPDLSRPAWMLLASLRSNRFEATDAAGKIEKMQDVGRAYANKWVEMTPFKALL
jgi:hypothetical protein